MFAHFYLCRLSVKFNFISRIKPKITSDNVFDYKLIVSIYKELCIWLVTMRLEEWWNQFQELVYGATTTKFHTDQPCYSSAARFRFIIKKLQATYPEKNSGIQDEICGTFPKYNQKL